MEEGFVAEPYLPQGGVLHVLKHDDLFAVFDARGDFHGGIYPVGPSMGADGLVQDDTRILSKFRLRLQGTAPELLSGGVGHDNVVFTAYLTNAAFRDKSNWRVSYAQIHLLRRRLLWQHKLHEALLIRNFADHPILFDLRFDVDADFRDVFEIRGMTRRRRGELLQPCRDSTCLTLSYRGLDDKTRTTAITFSVPIVINEQCITVPIELKAGGGKQILMTISSDGSTAHPSRAGYLSALKGSKREARHHIQALDRVRTSNPTFDAWVERAAADLSLLVTELDTGSYPYAGIPWFSVPFGRDAIVTALQVLWINPALARGVLDFLSEGQAGESSAFQSAEPGKILHEARKGEMAMLREVPFARYYGGVDTTPLFVMLAGAYLERTNDVAFCARIWPAVKAALEWIDCFGDADGDGFIEYLRLDPQGLQNQGWKDSDTSVFHSDGRFAEGAIALVEVQAYVVAAKRAAAAVASVIDKVDLAQRLVAEADSLQQKIDAQFWSSDLGTYVLALDGEKRPCAVRTSNPGHVLYCGAADAHKARGVARSLMGPGLFSGWGVRTVDTSERRYNPMSYHNGTVWPHDCSIAAAGLARYGMTEAASRILSGLFDAARRFPDFRLPELFCGFPRHADERPIAYPSACTPQAWASGAVFLLVQSSLGIEINARASLIRVTASCLPHWLDRVEVRDIQVGNGRATLNLRRQGNELDVCLSAVEGEVRLVHA